MQNVLGIEQFIIHLYVLQIELYGSVEVHRSHGVGHWVAIRQWVWCGVVQCRGDIGLLR